MGVHGMCTEKQAICEFLGTDATCDQLNDFNFAGTEVAWAAIVGIGWFFEDDFQDFVAEEFFSFGDGNDRIYDFFGAAMFRENALYAQRKGFPDARMVLIVRYEHQFQFGMGRMEFQEKFEGKFGAALVVDDQDMRRIPRQQAGKFLCIGCFAYHAQLGLGGKKLPEPRSREVLGICQGNMNGSFPHAYLEWV